MTPFGTALRNLRAERGMTQKALAQALGVTPAYLSALEHGRRGLPRFELLQRIAGHFNIIWDEADELFRAASLSHPRIVIDTSGLPQEATLLANRLAEDIRLLDSIAIEAMLEILDAAARQRFKKP